MIKLLFTILISLLLTFSVSSVLAQTDQEIVKKYGISFPIQELGNCQNISKCKVFCEDVKNQDACTSYAKQRGFYQKPQKEASDEEILQKAKGELGCNSMEQCQAFCEKEENMERCMDFAAKHDLAGGSNAAHMKQVISSLKSTFGCSSMNSCMEVCNSGDNMQKCIEIFRQAGFPVEVNYTGQGPAESPEVWCPKAGENCSWDGNQCTCGDQSSDGSTSTTSTQEVDFSADQPTSTTPTDNPYTVQGGETIYKSECLSAGCRWSDNPNSCDCAGVGKDVQGVSTNQGLLQQLLNFIQSL